jgi:triosephosphate isomerase
MRRRVVAGNWKMNGTRQSIEGLLAELLPGLADGVKTDVIVCPPYGYLGLVGRKLEGTAVRLGAQSVSEHASGAYTGEVAAAMLRDLGCSHAIVGHSERRALFGESSVVVADKFEAARAAGLVPILCVGETLDERDRGTTHEVIAEQLDSVLTRESSAGLGGALVAYEPVWAIGTGKTASPEQAQEIHQFIRSRVAQREPRVAADLPILYGGSVKPSNAVELFEMADIDGGLIGGAALNAQDFLQICRAAG